MTFARNQLKRLLSSLHPDAQQRKKEVDCILAELENAPAKPAQAFDDRDGIIWVDGQFLPWRDANTHLLTHTLHYGCGVFEGVRAYVIDDVPRIFRLHDHTDRLFASARIMNMDIAYDEDELNAIQCQVIARNNFRDLPKGTSIYLRPMCYFGSEGMGLQTKSLQTHTMVAAWEWGAYLPGEIDVCFSSFTRNHVASTMVRSKTNGHYVNSMLSHTEAVRNGYDEALLLDTSGYISEGSGANIFLIKNDVVYTPPVSSCLRGITRDTALYLCQQLGMRVEQKPLTRDDVYVADAAFFTGTAAEITHIASIDGKPFTHPQAQESVRALRDAYMDLVYGKSTTPEGWLTPCV